jgi:hypothetical protein
MASLNQASAFFPLFREPNDIGARRKRRTTRTRLHVGKNYFDVFFFPSTNQVRWRSPPHHSKGIADNLYNNPSSPHLSTRLFYLQKKKGKTYLFFKKGGKHE